MPLEYASKGSSYVINCLEPEGVGLHGKVDADEKLRQTD